MEDACKQQLGTGRYQLSMIHVKVVVVVLNQVICDVPVA